MDKGYETGMKVTFEPRSKAVIVNFRGRVTMLPETYASEAEALLAGEAFCRRNGWRPAPPRLGPPAKLRSAW